MNAKSYHAAAHGAAEVVGIGRAILLPTGHRHEHRTLPGHRRSGEPRGIVTIRFLLPDQLSVIGVQPVEPARLVPKQQHVSAAVADCQNRGAYRAARLIHPSDAARLRVQIVYSAARAADEQVVVEDSRLRERRDVSLVRKRPFELQVTHGIERKPGLFRRLKSGVGSRRAPAVPLLLWTGRDPHRTVAAICRRGRRGFAACRSSQPVGDGLALAHAHRVGDTDHRPRQFRVLRMREAGHLPQGLARWNSRIVLLVAPGAALLENSLPSLRRSLQPGARDQQNENPHIGLQPVYSVW